MFKESKILFSLIFGISLYGSQERPRTPGCQQTTPGGEKAGTARELVKVSSQRTSIKRPGEGQAFEDLRDERVENAAQFGDDVVIIAGYPFPWKNQDFQTAGIPESIPIKDFQTAAPKKKIRTKKIKN